MLRIILVLAYFSIYAGAAAQQFPYVHYTPKDGLANSRVKKAYQDSNGRMYFLTYGGLSMYNGARFKNYSTRNGLPMNIVNDMIEIGNDSFLVATNSSSINLLINGKMGIFNSEILAPLVNQFYRHDNGRIYLSSDFGLYVLEKNKIHQLNISGINNKNVQPNLGNITGIGNYLLVSTNDMSNNKGLFLYDIKNNRICDSLVNISAFLIGKDSRNRIWISTSHQLLIADTVLFKNGKLLLLPPDKGYRQTGNYSTINIAFGKDLAWFIYRDEEYRNAELRRIDENGKLHRIHLPDQMTAAYIQNIFIDRENNIWLCNDGEGVFKIAGSQLEIIEKPFEGSGGGQASYVFHNNGITWYNTISKKLFRIISNKPTSFTSNLNGSPHIFYHNGINLLANDGNHIYKASLQHGSGNINFQKIISLNDSDLFAGKPLVDPNGAIITNQISGVGVWFNNKLIDHVPIEHKEYIEDLSIDHNKRLWVVKRNFGIDVYRIQTNDLSNYLKPDFSIPTDKMPGSVRSFVIDKKGLIWIGTREHGLAAYTLKENQLEKNFHFHTGNGLSDNFVTSLACDSQNNIIAGTQTGLDLLLHNQANTYNIENLSRNSNLFAYINTTWADDTHFYALTNSGVVLKVSATAIENKVQSPVLLLDELRVNGKTLLQWPGSFSYKENNISFLVAAPSFIDEKQTRYTYLLQGSGNDRWSDTIAENSMINLTNLSRGSYTLKIRAFFHSTAYSPSELSYSFAINPPWWQTWWFIAIASLLIISAIIIALRFYYRRKMENQMAVLEKQQAIEKERTRIATDMHDDLGAGLSRIKFLSETIGIKKLQEQTIDEEITSIRNYSHEMIDKMGEIVWALNEKNDTLNDLLSYSRAYSVEYLAQHGIHCSVDAPEQVSSTFVSGEFRRNIYLVIKEALHNVVKHSQATHVKMMFEVNEKLNIIIYDNGIGIDKTNIRAYSNGLANMENRIKEIGGKFWIECKEGTTLKFAVPLSL